MSIALDKAFELDLPDLDTAFTHLAAFREHVQHLGHRANAVLLAKKAVEVIDRSATLSLRKGEKSREIATPVSHVWNEIEARRKEIRTSGYRDPEVDFSFSVVLFPIDGTLLGHAYCEQGDWVDELFSLPFVTYAPWWDNTDPTDDLSEEQWAERGATWRKILARDPAGRPSHCGVTMEMSPQTLYPKLDLIVECQPTFEARLAKIARDCMMHDALFEVLPNDDMSKTLERMMRVESFLSTRSGKEALAMFVDACRPLLKEHLQEEDFLGGKLSVAN